MDVDPRDRDGEVRDVEIPWVDMDGRREDGAEPNDSCSRDEDTRDRDRYPADRDNNDPRDVFVAGLELPCGPEREIVLDGDHRYDLNGDDSRTLATIGAFRVVAERDLRESRDESDPREPDFRYLRDEGLVGFVRLDGRERVLTLTERGRHLLDAHRRDGADDGRQAFQAGVSRARELSHDAQLYRAFVREHERLPCSIKMLRTPRTEASFYEFDQFERLVEASAREPQAHLVVLLGGEAGLRRGEMIGLEWTDVNLTKRQLCVARSDWRGHVSAPKGGRICYVPLTKRLAAALQATRHLRGPCVLCDNEGKPLTQKVVQVMMRRVARRANVKPGVHILRHTFCSHLAMRGAPARAIQELAGS
jgi:integrase